MKDEELIKNAHDDTGITISDASHIMILPVCNRPGKAGGIVR
jgi:hypothetical protein